jgi:CubicO group peptidase (beta-lactamase class C family)
LQASLTKVVATTAAVAILFDTGHLDLNESLASAHLLGPAYGAGGKAGVTALNCLLHNTGYPSDPQPNYWVCENNVHNFLL